MPKKKSPEPYVEHTGESNDYYDIYHYLNDPIKGLLDKDDGHDPLYVNGVKAALMQVYGFTDAMLSGGHDIGAILNVIRSVCDDATSDMDG